MLHNKSDNSGPRDVTPHLPGPGRGALLPLNVGLDRHLPGRLPDYLLQWGRGHLGLLLLFLQLPLLGLHSSLPDGGIVISILGYY